MTQETFCKILKNIKDELDTRLELYDLGVDLISYENKIEQSFWMLMKEVFNENQLDIIEWWIYEDVDKKLYDAKTEAEVEDLNNCENLYKYIFKDDK